ncbi:MAG: Ig-like domain-containing protein [Candidatus Marinimicrobia bacterium]|nr:Ig-like domain-containing protein [Candidatus Neomarinimicrobiota bacterium]
MQCASEAPPGGGPPDTTAPFLISASLENGATMVPLDHELEFIFSENLNPDIAERSITVFPLVNDLTKISVRGKYITISPTTRWDSSVVYSVILDKIISDYRGNSLEQPLQFSFTSGNYMPKNKITGKVNGLNTGSTAVICISRKTSYPDSIILSPEYYTQSGPKGEFLFEYLPAKNFYIAGYVDIDNSNNYKAKFDGSCVPSKPALIPDTTNTKLTLEAVYDNFMPGRLLRAESIDPTKTKLTFQKNMAKWNKPVNFLVNSMSVDTVFYNKKTCTLYHASVEGDSLDISLLHLFDQLSVPMPDSSLRISVEAWADSFYHFETLSEYLLISPPPSAEKLGGVYRSSADTTDLTLDKALPGFYKLPYVKTRSRGTWQINISFEDELEWLEKDSLYDVPLELRAEPDHGAVLGHLEIEAFQYMHLLLHNDQQNYDITIDGTAFTFNNVLPGTYTLSYYIDMNDNQRRDFGRPYPYQKPEILFDLDDGIDVRARWDTELSEAYKIVIENE